MEAHERELIAFLAGDLDEQASNAFDEHLLRCERCWRAVQQDRQGKAAAARLGEAAPPELADQVAFAVQMAAQPTRRRQLWRWVFTGGGLLAAALITVIVVLFPLATQRADPPVIATVVHAAQDMPAATTTPRGAADTPIVVRAPVDLASDGAQVQLRYYRLEGIQVVVAISDQPFPTPAGVGIVTPGAMAWIATRGPVGLYCPHANILIAAPVPARDLPGLASRLPLF